MPNDYLNSRPNWLILIFILIPVFIALIEFSSDIILFFNKEKKENSVEDFTIKGVAIFEDGTTVPEYSKIFLDGITHQTGNTDSYGQFVVKLKHPETETIEAIFSIIPAGSGEIISTQETVFFDSKGREPRIDIGTLIFNRKGGSNEIKADKNIQKKDSTTSESPINPTVRILLPNDLQVDNVIDVKPKNLIKIKKKGNLSCLVEIIDKNENYSMIFRDTKGNIWQVDFYGNETVIGSRRFTQINQD